MANDLFAVLGVHLRRVHAAVGQSVPVPGQLGFQRRCAVRRLGVALQSGKQGGHGRFDGGLC
jgi:hypothetical protein